MSNENQVKHEGWCNHYTGVDAKSACDCGAQRIADLEHENEMLREKLRIGEMQFVDATREAALLEAQLHEAREVLRPVDGTDDEDSSVAHRIGALIVRLASPVPGLAESGPYTLADVDLIEKHRGKPYARLRETVLALDAAKAELDSEKRLTAKALESLLNRWPLPSELEPRVGTLEWHEVLGQLDRREDRINDLEYAAHQILAKHPDEALEKLLDENERLSYATAEQLDAAKADVARLREVAADCEEWLRAAEGTEANEYGAATAQREELCDALAATDSTEWLAKHDAEVTEPLRKRIAELEMRVAKLVMESVNDALKEKVSSLEAQLTAATNDAARAELRARDLGVPMRRLVSVAQAALASATMSLARATELDECVQAARDAFVYDQPDSDARLREVMGSLVDATWESESHQNDETKNRLIDEVLGVKP